MRDSLKGPVNMENFLLDDDWIDPYEIDITVAHPARRYNYWLGGTDNFEADRISGDAVAKAFPTIKVAAIENRGFLRRAVTFLVEEAGVRQFLDIGTGIPAAGNVHEVAQSIAPDSRVVYVDNDPIVLAHARRLLGSAQDGATAYIHADLRDSDAILQHPDLQKTLDLSKPVALMLIWVLHLLDDSEDPHAHIPALTSALAPGSHLVISHATGDFMSTEVSDAVQSAARQQSIRGRDPFQLRDRAEIARFFAGMELVPPGVASVSEWRADRPPGERPANAVSASYGAVARIR